METVVLELNERQSIGKSASKRYRREGLLPINLYGKNGNKALVTCYKTFLALASKAASSQVFTIKSDDKSLDQKKAIVKEVQKTYTDAKVLHVDLLELNESEQVKVVVPLKVVGEAPGVKIQSGILEVSARKLVVRCFPKDVPAFIKVDISNLEMGKRIKASDLDLGANVTLRGNPNETIASIVVSRAARLEETASATPAAGAAPADAAAAAPAAAAKK